MNDTVKEQVLAIRATGLTNMFDVNEVQRLAFERDFFELVCYIEEDRAGYCTVYPDGRVVGYGMQQSPSATR